MKKVAIITRTKNRILTLERVLNSINQQTFRDYTWVVVNDGGIVAPVDKIIERSITMGIETNVIHNKESLGREAASNIGIKNSKSKYIVVLDDDDSWNPNFLNITVSFLENNDNILFKGVVTRTTIIEEEICDNRIIFNKSYPFDPDLEKITILRLARCKMFSNLSFLYHREIIDKIGLYREDYPVIGDWDFYLRFIRQYNIGVIPDYLANYHIRASISKNDYDNSVLNRNRETKYLSLLRDELLRNDLDQNRIDIGVLINLGYELNQIESSIKRGSILWVIRNKLKKLFVKT